MTAGSVAQAPAGLDLTLEILSPGVQTTVQDLRGRRGLWGVGVPPSGAFDGLAFALANLAVGNDPGAAGIEAAMLGPALRFTGRGRAGTLAAVAGACARATLDGRPVRPGEPFLAPPGSVLDFGPCGPAGMRGYLAVRGGIAAPRVLGSRAAFLLGRFGGGQGRALAAGDVLALGREENCAAPAYLTPVMPQLTGSWRLRVIPGPHGAPDYFDGAALADLFAARWQVDHRSDRTGIRLAGPAVRFARADGGEAGLHPCNIHDSAYPIGGIMVSGDTPVIVGPDGPSLGGFVVPAAVIAADLWKLGQLRPGDQVHLVPVTPDEAQAARAQRAALLADPRSAVAAVLFDKSESPAPATRSTPAPTVSTLSWERPRPLLLVPESGARPELRVRFSGDHHLLVEAGPARLDLTVRARIHLLHRELTARAVPGIAESVEGVRSLLLGYDPAAVDPDRLAAQVGQAWQAAPEPAEVELPVREVTMPICFDDPDAHEAMRRYQRGVRPDAPWCPDNVEFIRRVNGLATRDEVFDIVQAAAYLVIGLGDVYLGAPVAVPLDPAHRLVTTKYDPPRTWTPENAVGIGGAYLCVYGMEGPGGYQLVGRTIPVWRKPPPDAGPAPAPGPGAPGPAPKRPDPWLLRVFDLLRFVPVDHDELMQLRAGVADGDVEPQMRATTLRLGSLPGPDAPVPPATAAFTERRTAAFAEERRRWADKAAGVPPTATRNTPDQTGA
ncbi:MAG TPA: 5-oxoprolinase/urea amidolyase family protein [Actinocrinis sp.]|nr:5-oxoprolinase/urea amidolyase family protein [Actinocrinis sp.]